MNMIAETPFWNENGAWRETLIFVNRRQGVRRGGLKLHAVSDPLRAVDGRKAKVFWANAFIGMNAESERSHWSSALLNPR